MANYLNYPAINILEGLIQSTRAKSHNTNGINKRTSRSSSHSFICEYNWNSFEYSQHKLHYWRFIVKANCFTSKATAIKSRDKKVMMFYKKPLKAEVFDVCVGLSLIEHSKYSVMMNGKVSLWILNSLFTDYSKSDTSLQIHRTIQPTANHRGIHPTLNHREIQNFPEHRVIQHSANYREIQQRQDLEAQTQYKSDME